MRRSRTNPPRVEILGAGEIYAFKLRVPIWAWPHLILVAFILLVILAGMIDDLTADRLFTALFGPAPGLHVL